MKIELNIPPILIDDLAKQANKLGITPETFASLLLLESLYGSFSADSTWEQKIAAVNLWIKGDMGRSAALNIIGHEDVGILVLFQKILEKP